MSCRSSQERKQGRRQVLDQDQALQKKAQLLLQRPPHDEKLSRAQSAQRTHTTPTTQKSVCVEIRKPAFGHATAVVLSSCAIYIYSYKYSIAWTEQLYSCTLLNLDFRFCSSYMQTATFAAPPVRTLSSPSSQPCVQSSYELPSHNSLLI